MAPTLTSTSASAPLERAYAAPQPYAPQDGDTTEAEIQAQIAQLSAAQARIPVTFARDKSGVQLAKSAASAKARLSAQRIALESQLRQHRDTLSAQRISQGNLDETKRKVDLETAMQPEEIAAKRATTAKTAAETRKSEYEQGVTEEGDQALVDEETTNTLFPRSLAELRAAKEAQRKADAEAAAIPVKAAEAAATTTARKGAEAPFDVSEAQATAREFDIPYRDGVSAATFREEGMAARSQAHAEKLRAGGLTEAQITSRARMLDMKATELRATVLQKYGVSDDMAMIFGHRFIPNDKAVSKLGPDMVQLLNQDLAAADRAAEERVSASLGWARGTAGGATPPAATDESGAPEGFRRAFKAMPPRFSSAVDADTWVKANTASLTDEEHNGIVQIARQRIGGK